MSVYTCVNKKHVKGIFFFSTTRKTRFVFRGLKMLFFHEKGTRKGCLFLNLGDLKMLIFKKKG